MDTASLFYKESGNVNVARMVAVYFMSFLATFVLGLTYSILVEIIPIVYLSFLLTVGFGLALGFIARFFNRISHNRNKRSRLALAAFLGLVANFFQWTAYVAFAVNGGVPTLGEYFSIMSWIFSSQSFFGVIADINSVGLWSMFGVTVNGFVLTSIWIVEFLIILLGPIVAVYRTKPYPYSEVMNKWYPKLTLFNDFEHLATPVNLLNDLQQNPVQAIQNMEKGLAHRHTKVHLYYLEQEETQYLSFDKVTVESGEKKKKEVTPILYNFAISKQHANTISSLFESKVDKLAL